jgi:hypothetical protein
MISEDDRVTLANDPNFVCDFLAMYEFAVEPKELFVYPGFGHATEILNGANGNEAKEMLLLFVNNILGNGS